MFFATQQLPVELIGLAAKLPVIGSKKKREQAENFQRLIQKMKEAQSIFTHFAFTEYVYDCEASDDLWQVMSEADKKTFPFNARLINWERTLQGFQYGIRRFFLREDCLGPEDGFT